MDLTVARISKGEEYCGKQEVARRFSEEILSSLYFSDFPFLGWSFQEGTHAQAQPQEGDMDRPLQTQAQEGQ